MRIKFFSAGGTIDKAYFDAKSSYEVGASQVPGLLAGMQVGFAFEHVQLMRKDSLDMDEADRQLIHDAIAAEPWERVILTHGTDTMIETALKLCSVPEKTIVLTGAMEPWRFSSSDAVFNIGCAIGAVQCLPAGVYLAMNGCVFNPRRVRKNRDAGRFEAVEPNGSAPGAA